MTSSHILKQDWELLLIHKSGADNLKTSSGPDVVANLKSTDFILHSRKYRVWMYFIHCLKRKMCQSFHSPLHLFLLSWACNVVIVKMLLRFIWIHKKSSLSANRGSHIFGSDRGSLPPLRIFKTPPVNSQARRKTEHENTFTEKATPFFSYSQTMTWSVLNHSVRVTGFQRPHSRGNRWDDMLSPCTRTHMHTRV